MRAAMLLLSLLILIGCDMDGTDPAPFSEALIVEVEDETMLRLTTDGAPGCATPMVIETEARSNELAVDVLGLVVHDGPVCLAIIPSTWTTTLPDFEGTLQLEIAHNRETDRYIIRETPTGRQLEVVRSSVTRPGPG